MTQDLIEAQPANGNQIPPANQEAVRAQPEQGQGNMAVRALPEQGQGNMAVSGLPRTGNANNAPRSIIEAMAARYGMDTARFKQTVQATVIKGNCSDEQFAAFMLVAKEYDLNPFTKEVYAFPSNGGIQPIVSIDGWMKMINTHPAFDGMEFKDTLDGQGKLASITCTIYRKDRNHPTAATEYMAECARNSDTWRKWPARMLRHKAAIQAARYAFGFSGIADPDEEERMQEATVIQDTTPITQDQRDHLIARLNEHDIEIDKFCAYLRVNAIGEIKATDYPKALTAIQRRMAQARQELERADREAEQINA